MWSWFKKKKTADQAEANAAVPVAVAEPTPPASDTRLDQIIARWDQEIADATARIECVLAEAVAASEPLIAATALDLTPLVLPWNTIPPRVREARDQISAAWDRISDDIAERCPPDGVMEREGAKRDAAGLEIDLAHDRAYGGVMARAADQMRQRALINDAASHPCGQCGAPLDKVTPVSQSLNVACVHCRAINTIHPRDALRMFAASGAMHLAIEAARAHNEAMRRLDQQIKHYRDAKQVPLALLVEFDTVSRNHWTVRLETEAMYNPEQARYVPAKLQRYMDDTSRTLRRYWQWRQHETGK